MGKAAPRDRRLTTGAVLSQLLLEAFTFPTGAASVLEPPEPAPETAV